MRSSFAGPAVANGRVFVMDWTPAQVNRGTERVLALDEKTGKTLWVREWPANYTGLQGTYAIGPRTGETKTAEYTRLNPRQKVPMLQDGDFSLCQSSAIYKYVARKIGLYGANLKEDARIDEVAETAGDILFDLGMLFWDPRFAERRPEHRQTLRKKLAQVQEYFERVAPDPEHWVLPGRYTLADVRMAYALETVLPLHPGLVEEFPRLHAAMLRFFSESGVRQYVRSDRRCRSYTVELATFGGKPEETHQFTGE